MHGRTHGSTSREVCLACSLPRQNEAAVGAVTVITDPKELQAARCSPSKETVMQSLKTVTGGIRNLDNNVHEITDLLAPNDPGNLYSCH